MTGVVFRSEVAILLACHTAYLFLHPHIRLPLSSIIPAGLIGTLLGLTLTVPVDSFFWQKWPLWPELVGFIYNIVDKQASNWGTQPWHFFFTSALPRLLFNPLVYQICIPFTLFLAILRRSAFDVLIPNIVFLVIYSFQPHKEWRFIIYVVPPILAVAGAGASWIWTRRTKSFVYRVLSLALVASTLASFVASFGMLAVSRLNYPGAEALNHLHDLASYNAGVVKVHMDTLACMTGVTRFMEKPAPVLGDETATFWVYDKTEDEHRLMDPIFWESFDYALAERPERVIGKWHVVDTVEGFAGVGLVGPGQDVKNDHADLDHLNGLWRRTQFDGGALDELKQVGRHFWNGGFETLMRKYITRGWWLKLKMEPRIKILMNERGPILRELYDREENCQEPL